MISATMLWILLSVSDFGIERELGRFPTETACEKQLEKVRSVRAWCVPVRS